jgi:phthiodiolone/phenolphthiodiolone dimycocerosates ketoreductase
MGFFPSWFWTPERVALAAHAPSPHTFFHFAAPMTAAATSTETMRLGTCVTEVVRRHPADLAQLMLTLHHFSSGRAILGLGAGEAENIEPYGLAFKPSAAVVEEAVSVIRALWGSGGAPVDYEGRHFRLDRAVMGLGPVEADGRPTTPPIWLAAHGPRMLELTGRAADGWIPTYLDPPTYADAWRRVADAAVGAGRDPAAIERAMWCFVVVHPDRSVVDRVLRHPVTRAACLIASDRMFEAHGVRHPLVEAGTGFSRLIPEHVDRDDYLKAVDQVPESLVDDYVVAGTPDEVAARLQEYAALGLQLVIPQNITFFSDPGLARASFDALKTVADAVSDTTAPASAGAI